MADRGSALSPIVVRSTDPRAIRKQTIGRGLIALVWAIADVGQVALAWSDGTGDRAGDAPLVAFAASAAVGVVLLCVLAMVNFRAVNAVGDWVQQARLLHYARLAGWLCGVRVVAILVVLFAVRDTGADAPVAELSFHSIVIFAFVDAAVALAIAARTAAGLPRSAQPNRSA